MCRTVGVQLLVTATLVFGAHRRTVAGRCRQVEYDAIAVHAERLFHGLLLSVLVMERTVNVLKRKVALGGVPLSGVSLGRSISLRQS